jgi:hypothetical protein
MGHSRAGKNGVAVFDYQIQAGKDSSMVLPNGVKKYLK